MYIICYFISFHLSLKNFNMILSSSNVFILITNFFLSCFKFIYKILCFFFFKSLIFFSKIFVFLFSAFKFCLIILSWYTRVKCLLTMSDFFSVFLCFLQIKFCDSTSCLCFVKLTVMSCVSEIFYMLMLKNRKNFWRVSWRNDLSELQD